MEKQPIILIPGIQGTKLNNINDADFKTLWTGIKKFFTNIHELALQFDGQSDKGAENIIERADVENLAYSEIINYLRSIGYRVYIFGYDWRKSNEESAKELGEFIQRIQRKLNETKMNFVTHSMGALVLSAYLKKLSEKERLKVLNKAVFTVPPFLGSMEASFNLTMGKSRLFNSSDDFRKVGRTFPGLYELLPVYDGAYEFQNKKTEENYNLYDYSSFWQQLRNPESESYLYKNRLMTHRLTELGKLRDQRNLIFDLSKMNKELRSRCIILAGGGEATKDKVFVTEDEEFKFFFDYEKHEENEDGDGTVPIQSSTVFKDSILTCKMKTSWIEKRADSRVILSDWHAFFLNNGRVQNIIKRFMDPKAVLKGEWYQSRGGKIEK